MQNSEILLLIGEIWSAGLGDSIPANALRGFDMRCVLRICLLYSNNITMASPCKLLMMGLLWFGASLDVMASSVGCNDGFVQMHVDELVIDVAPTHVDDTVNIQCALDAAVRLGIPIVRLESDSYEIGHLSVEGFVGSFQGRTRAGTIVRVTDDAIECSAMHSLAMQSAVIKFVKGEPRLRYMTINANVPCRNGSILDAIVHFTGESSQAGNCEFDVIFGVVDRIAIDGKQAAHDIRAAISATPEGHGCKDSLLGTFKLNRSMISNTSIGVITSMKSGAQVDINFNEFHNNLKSVYLVDTNQNTTITTNEFFGDNTTEEDYFGVLVANVSDSPPASTRVIVHNNDFTIAASNPERWSFGVSVRWIISKVSSIVSNNRFVLSGDHTYGLRYRNNSNAHVTANRFNGSGARAILVTGNGSVPVNGWTITANTGLAGFDAVDGEDIRLDYSTSDCIIGPGQGATILDNGENNTILPQ